MSSPSTTMPLEPRPTAQRLAALLVVVWLAAMAQLLWHLEQQRIAAGRQLLHFDTQDLPGPPRAAPAGVAKALYFLGGQCACNDAARAEIIRLQRDPDMPAAQFVATPTMLAAAIRPLAAEELAGWRGRIPATPTVALWDAGDKLIYFGPINVSAGCGDGRSYLQTALRTLRSGDGASAAVKPWDAVACACPA